MTGAFTIPIRLSLTPQHRRRLEHAVRSHGGTPADLVSAIVANAQPRPIDEQAAAARVERIPMLVYLAPAQRDLFEAYARSAECGIAELIADLLADHLEGLPDPPADPPVDQSRTIRAYRREITRLRDRQAAAGAEAPPWLEGYIADLEAELRRLGQANTGGSV